MQHAASHLEECVDCLAPLTHLVCVAWFPGTRVRELKRASSVLEFIPRLPMRFGAISP
jgi:hypothetical protein